MDSRFNDIDSAAQGTCEWLLRHEMYTGWASYDKGLLWIKGKPGSGKSTLLGHVLRNVVATSNIGESDLILSFFFHGRGAELQRTPLGLFRSLLHQLLSQTPDALQDLVATFQERCRTVGESNEKWQWHPRELQRFFESSLREVLKTRSVWLFVDALDECGEESAVELANTFRSWTGTLLDTSSKHFHLCFTCRHYPMGQVDCQFQICTEEENKEDISTFVHGKLSSFTSRIPDLITSRAQGVFLWAWLVVKKVLELDRKGVGLNHMEAEVLLVPQKLHDLYCELIQGMGPGSLKLIEWICFAMRPLSLDELRWAMTVEPDCQHGSLPQCESAGDFPSEKERMMRRVQMLSRGLAEIESETTTVQFIHQSVKDFFVEQGLSVLNETGTTDLVVGMAHNRLSRICIRYLAILEIDRSTSWQGGHLRSEYPFLDYSSTSWVGHMKESDNARISQEDLLECFTWPSDTVLERWVYIFGILENNGVNCPPQGTSLAHVMSRYGVATGLEAVFKRAGGDVHDIVNARDSLGRTPLWWAVAQEHEAVIELLLKWGADTEVADKWHRTPLCWAAVRGQEAAMRLLLDRNANIEAADNHGQTPLSFAAVQGHEATVRLLLDRGAPIDGTDSHGRTPLRWAADKGREAVVRLLLDRGADIDAADNSGRTALLLAAENGYEAVVRQLVDRGADIEKPDASRRTSLWWAAATGREAVVGLLLDRGADRVAADIMGQTPLSWATTIGHEGVVRLLLDQGANAVVEDKEDQTSM